mgnify:CR=1 FL=1
MITNLTQEEEMLLESLINIKYRLGSGLYRLRKESYKDVWDSLLSLASKMEIMEKSSPKFIVIRL